MKRSLIKNLTFIPVLLALFLVHSSLIAQDTKPFLGTWNGALSVMGQELEITIELSLDEEKNIQGNIDVPIQGATDIPLGEFNLEGKKISFKIVHPEVQGDPAFNGELDETGKKISGEFSQGGAVGTFSVEKE
ncbi:MAG: hypothetical protein JSV17_00935 [Candidatus Aminicenantes bacterium]|nr:MAG: hypothetical protein JSV17_00935 [Candidatus Aminicenantes bacterium]